MDEVEHGKCAQRQFSLSHSLSKPSVSEIFSTRARLRSMKSAAAKVINDGLHGGLDDVLVAGVVDCSHRILSICDDIIKPKDAGHLDAVSLTPLESDKIKLKSCHKWMEKFKRRHKICRVPVHCESASAAVTVGCDALLHLQKALQNYANYDIYSANERGLHYSMSPDRTPAVGHVKVLMKDKARLTCLIGCKSTCSNMVSLRIIGESLRPHALIRKEVLTLASITVLTARHG